MRSRDKERLRQEIKAITESAIRDDGESPGNAGGPLPPSGRARRLSPNLLVDRIFILALVALLTPS